jgi:DNA (cytosine-5)-methyltransferase 1
MKIIKVVELFAGVGGFRLGLEKVSSNKIKFETVWNSQWEPGQKKQYASEIYRKVFGDYGHSNEDIQKVIENNFEQIPDHDLLVGGFPCQDYSVAKTLNQSEGIVGKKGVLWWSIYNILYKKGDKAPQFVFLENVDRLLKSPSKQKGKDFAVMLASLSDLGYITEWRVINAADYGFPQRRRRTFIFAYKKDTKIFKDLNTFENKEDWILGKGVFNHFFKINKHKKSNKLNRFKIEGELHTISSNFSKENPKKTPFEDSGIMIDREVYTLKSEPVFKGERNLLKDIVLGEINGISDEYFIDEESLEKWKYLKGPKKEKRITETGYEYNYSEGGMAFPDDLEKPSRTIITGEGGKSPSRFKHVVKTNDKYRRLTPVELERLNMFPDNHTEYLLDGTKTPDVKRAFIMGNALVVGVIEKIGDGIAELV